jgi:hypothetical protein
MDAFAWFSAPSGSDGETFRPQMEVLVRLCILPRHRKQAIQPEMGLPGRECEGCRSVPKEVGSRSGTGCALAGRSSHWVRESLSGLSQPQRRHGCSWRWETRCPSSLKSPPTFRSSGPRPRYLFLYLRWSPLARPLRQVSAGAHASDLAVSHAHDQDDPMSDPQRL